MIKPFGNSIVCLQDGSIVKVHIHTVQPSNVIDISRNYGEFITFKLENMQLQHNEYSVLNEKKDPEKKKGLGIVAVVNGDEIAKDYRDLGVDVVLDGGSSMNTSSDEFVHACESINANKILIFPNNVNSFLSARQAIEILKAEGKVIMIESKNVMQCFYALQMDMPDASIDERIEDFKNNIDLVTTIGVSIASKDYTSDSFNCVKGDFIATVNDQLVAKGTDAVDAFKNALNSLCDLDDKYAMMAYLGKGYDGLLEPLSNILDNEFSIEHSVKEGKQDIYLILAGLL